MSAAVFNASVIVTEQMERLMCVAAQEVTYRAITACALEYNFNAEEALRFLRLDTIKVSRSKTEKAVKSKVVSAKSSFALPYNGECNDALCHGLRQNNGLYTQCQTVRKGDNMFCKSCQSSADKNDGIPEYGTIEQRKAVGIFEYVDPKGRKPSAYVKIMKKLKLTEEQVIEEAGKLNIIIDANHFVEEETKRGRPKAEKEPKEAKGAKGRPKKTKKVLEIEGEEEDLFASLVASANSTEEEEVEEEVVVKPVKKGKSDEERIQKEQEKEAKEAKLAAEKAEKALKKQQEEEAKVLKKQQEEEAKAAKEAQRLKEKEEKEAAKAAKTKKQVVSTSEVVEEEEQQPDVVKKIEIDGKKYLKSKNTGIIYDYKEYIQNGEQVVVGKWNETKNKIDFTVVDEESEEEYDE